MHLAKHGRCNCELMSCQRCLPELGTAAIVSTVSKRRFENDVSSAWLYVSTSKTVANKYAKIELKGNQKCGPGTNLKL